METSRRKNNFGILAISICLLLPDHSVAARLSVLFGGGGSGGNGTAYARVFVTSTTYDGNLGGIAGADAKCQARADAASLGGTWKAIISDSTTNAITRTKNRTKPVYDLSGRLVFNPSVPISLDASGVVAAQPWGTYPANTIYTTELGTPPAAVAVWTSTNSNGLVVTNTHCTNWTTNSSGSGAYGNASSSVSIWSYQGSASCASLYRLYCLEDE